MQILKASAGSGKTYALAYEYIKCVINKPEKYSSILAVTFTNKATEEMKRRILNELNSLKTPLTPKQHPYLKRLTEELGLDTETIAHRASRTLNLILHDYSRFSVMTIDKFFQKILRAFVRELGIESDYTVDFNQNYLLDIAIDNLTDSSTDNESIKRNLDAFIDKRIENSKNYDLKRELSRFATNIFSDSFEESSIERTREIFEEFYTRVTEINDGLREEIISTAREAQKIINEAGLSEQDFPRKTQGLARYINQTASGNISGYNSYVESAYKDISLKWGKSESIKHKIHPLLSKICSICDTNNRFFTSYDICAKNYHIFLLLSDINREMEEVCRTKNIILLSLTTRLLSGLIAENDAPFIYEKCGNSYDTFMIDEFQDTSVKQWKNFAPLINNALAQCETIDKCVTIVGDVKQSIYRWRGGDWKLLQGDLTDDLLQPERTEYLTLDTNWRSKRTVVAFNNAMMRNVVDSANEELNETLTSCRTSGAIDLNEETALRDTLLNAYSKMEQKYAPKNSGYEGYVEVNVCDFKEDENLQRMIYIIKNLQDRGCKASSIAVITRTNSEAASVVEYLLSYKSNEESKGYCFDAISNQALYLVNSDAVRFVITCFKYAVATYNDDSLIRAEYNYISQRALSAELPEQERELINSLREMSLSEAFEQLLSFYNIANNESSVAYLQALYEQILNFSSQNISDIPLFLDWWKKEGEKQSITLPDGQNAINVITIHSSKGLEYDVVIIPYLDWSKDTKPSTPVWAHDSMTPFSAANNTILSYSDKLAESHFAYTYSTEKVMGYVDNINTLYVALTRAESELYIMIPETIKKKSIAEQISGALKSAPDGKTYIYSSSKSGDLLDTSVEGYIKEWQTINGINRISYIFGEPTHFETEDNTPLNSQIIDKLLSEDYHKNGRVQLRYSTDRYTLDADGEEKLTPRSYGILMHRLFERIETIEGIDTVIDKMNFDGELNDKECHELKILITESFKNSDIRQFFDGEWTVKNEQDILIPTKGNSSSVTHRRPDRVIINQKRIKVLDYKFGTTKNDKNLKQMSEYIKLLMEMGYEDVEGYVWYVQLGELDYVTS